MRRRDVAFGPVTSTILDLFGRVPALIGVVHVGALPGTPRASASVDALLDAAALDARRLREAGFHGLVVENMHDRPYLRGAVGPEVVAALSVITKEVRRVSGLPVGVQVLAGANREALAVALAAGAAFVRVEGFVFAHVGDEGIHQSVAGELLRYRRAIGAAEIRVFADIKKKHSAHTLTADVSLVETAQAAAFFLADGVVVTGSATGEPADPDEVRAVAGAVEVPTLVGSGVNPGNVKRYAAAHALIVGSSLKAGGVWSNPVDLEQARALVQAFEA